MNDKPEILSLTANIVSAFVGRNPVATAELRHVIHDVYCALRENANGHALTPSPASELKPAVPMRSDSLPVTGAARVVIKAGASINVPPVVAG